MKKRTRKRQKIVLAVLVWLCSFWGIEGKAEWETEEQSERETRLEDMREEKEEKAEEETAEKIEEKTEKETEKETEEKKEVYVSQVWPAYQNGCKTYDGTNLVELEADVMGLSSGMHLDIWGVAASETVGTWNVEIKTKLWAEEWADVSVEEYDILMEKTEIFLTITPKPLTITISDGVKYYYEELNFENVEFLSEDGPIQVVGFVEDQIPDGFEMPEIMWNETVIQKESPIYKNGERVEYKGAIVVKTDKAGNVIGNATDNYCFVTDQESGYYESGSIFLREPVLLGQGEYYICGVPKAYVFQDKQGVLWIRQGSRLQMCPQTENGFDQGTVTEPLLVSGSVAMQLLKTDKKGNVTAGSQIQYIPYQVDDTAPQAVIGVEDTSSQEGDVIYRNKAVTCGVRDLWDEGSGIRSVQICSVEGKAAGEQDPELLFREQPEIWQSGIQTTLTKEGIYTVMVRMEDQVGNVGFVKSGQIILDWTKPDLEIQGIESGSANNDVVAPLIFSQDEYFKEGSLRVVLKGAKGGERTFSQIRTAIAYGEQVQVQDIPREKRWDDLYVLQAEASDLAGNTIETKLVFSVNRFGSVYVLDTKTKEQLSSYYMKEPSKLVVWEFNVNAVPIQKIRMGHGQSVTQLVKGKHYQVVQHRDAYGFYEYCYRIAAENFQEEGAYYLVLATMDQAQNHTDSQRQKLKLEFAIDQTDPTVLISGIEENECYEEERIAVISCTDNQYLNTVRVYLNDELVAENQEERQNISISVNDSWQCLKVEAVDGAGNVTVSESISFFMGKAEDIQSDTKTDEKMDIKTNAKTDTVIDETVDGQADKQITPGEVIQPQMQKRQTQTVGEENEESEKEEATVVIIVMVVLGILVVVGVVTLGVVRKE